MGKLKSLTAALLVKSDGFRILSLVGRLVTAKMKKRRPPSFIWRIGNAAPRGEPNCRFRCM